MLKDPLEYHMTIFMVLSTLTKCISMTYTSQDSKVLEHFLWMAALVDQSPMSLIVYHIQWYLGVLSSSIWHDVSV